MAFESTEMHDDEMRALLDPCVEGCFNLIYSLVFLSLDIFCHIASGSEA